MIEQSFLPPEHQPGPRRGFPETSCFVSACAWLACLVVIAGYVPRPVHGAGTETSRQADDLTVTVDSRWAGGAYGGYYPIRVRVANTGPDRELLFRFVESGGSAGSRLPRVERRISSTQDAVDQFTLSIPVVGLGTYGQFQVLENGRILDKLSAQISLPEAQRDGQDRPALLVISPTNVDCDRFEEAVTAVSVSATAAPGGMRGTPFGTRANDSQVIPPTLLPESWVDYSCLDVVALSLATLEQIPAGARNALVKWTECGGTLIVFDVNQPPAESTELGRLLSLGADASQSKNWISADPAERRRLVAAPPDARAVPAPPMAPATALLVPKTNRPDSHASVWPAGGDAFAYRDVMLGRVYAFSKSPFPGSMDDWGWWLSSVGSDRWRWVGRLGISGRIGGKEFLQFMIPGVGGVPVISFLVLITAFTILIGPLNYVMLRRRKQLFLLVITIPVIALVTSMSLFGYAIVADGFGVQTRVRSFTVLNQENKTAVSLSRIALYAGLAPSSGLSFSSDTMVLPIWPQGASFEAGTLDWTNSQNLTAGWFRSRNLTQFETLSNRAERGRVEIGPPGKGGTVLDVSNGLACDIESMLIKDADGALYLAPRIPAGGSGKAAKVRPAETAEFAKRLAESRLGGRIDESTDHGDFFSGPRRRTRAIQSMFSGTATYDFSQSWLEKNLVRGEHPAEAAADGGLSPRSFFATTSENPGVEIGLPNARTIEALHVIWGRF